MDMFNLLAGASSIIGLFAAFYFYRRQQQAEGVARGFFRAIQIQVSELRGQLIEAKGIANNQYFDVLRARVDSSLSATNALMQNLEVYRQTLWHLSDNGRANQKD